jgi:O-6-methylguanine DNA methyltransferase
MTPFERRVLTIVSRVPAGRVVTYGDVARLAGRPGAARAVGNIMQQATRPGLPYHRVIAAGGRLGGYSSLSLKRSLLAAEGLTVTPARVVGFAKIRWPASAREASYGAVAPKRPRKAGRKGGNGRKSDGNKK